MTTLELAEAIAAEARCAETHEQGAQAVLRVLREQSCWFCSLSKGPIGETVQQTLPLE